MKGKIGKIGLVFVLVIVALLLGTYGLYAASYQGNYNVSVKVPVHGADYNHGNVFVTAPGVTADSTHTSMWQIWPKLAVTNNEIMRYYIAYCELNISSDRHVAHEYFDITSTQDLDLMFEFKNVEPGQGTLHIYILDQTHLASKVYDHTISIIVG